MRECENELKERENERERVEMKERRTSQWSLFWSICRVLLLPLMDALHEWGEVSYDSEPQIHIHKTKRERICIQ